MSKKTYNKIEKDHTKGTEEPGKSADDEIGFDRGEQYLQSISDITNDSEDKCGRTQTFSWAPLPLIAEEMK